MYWFVFVGAVDMKFYLCMSHMSHCDWMDLYLKTQYQGMDPDMEVFSDDDSCGIWTYVLVVTDIVVSSKPPLSPTLDLRSSESSPLQRGRKLPTVPRTGRKKDDSSKSNTMPRRKKDVEFSKEKILQELGIGQYI